MSIGKPPPNITVRVDGHERALIEQGAKQAGVNVSQFMRDAAIRSALQSMAQQMSPAIPNPFVNGRIDYDYARVEPSIDVAITWGVIGGLIGIEDARAARDAELEDRMTLAHPIIMRIIHGK